MSVTIPPAPMPRVASLGRSVAAELLENSDLSVNEIARELGYSTTSNFIRAFQRMSGLTPSKYRMLQK